MNKNCHNFQTPSFGQSKECIITSYNSVYEATDFYKNFRPNCSATSHTRKRYVQYYSEPHLCEYFIYQSILTLLS